MKNETSKNYIWLAIFGIAMGFLEAIIVVYLRRMFYPTGFDFPLEPFPRDLYIIELIRELSTIIMLVSVGALAGKTFPQKFAYFLYSFGIWDIFYYIALKIFLNWPDSLLSWDILFLIPIVWTGPVIAPVICSLTMIALAYFVIASTENNINFKIKGIDWAFILVGAFLIFISFIWDFGKLLITSRVSFEELFASENFASLQVRLSVIPYRFQWILYTLGEILILIDIVKIAIYNKK